VANQIAVTTDDVRGLARDCTRTGTAVINELNTLMGRVTGVVNGSWVGQASGSFAGYFKEFHQGQVKVQDALDAISQQLKGAADSYEQTEQGIAGSFRR
jgi:WXG100 family type VII secretion target